MIKARSLARKEFIPDSEQGEDKQTTFFYKEMATSQLAAIQDLTLREVDKDNKDKEITSTRIGTGALLALEQGLCGWSNFIDEDGLDIPFDNNPERAREMVDFIPPAIAFELAGAIMGGDKLDEEEEKNLSDI